MIPKTLFSEYRGLRRENYVLFFGAIVTNLGGMVWALVTLILSRKMGMNAEQVAIVMTAYGLALLPVALLGGRMADRFDKKRNIICMDIATVVCFMICAFRPLDYLSLFIFALGALCQNAEAASYDALIADINPTADRTRAYSLRYLGVNLGSMLAPTLGGLLFEHYLWLVFFASAVSIGTSTLLIFFLVRDTSRAEEAEDMDVYQQEQDGASALSIIREHRILILYFVAIALALLSRQFYGYLIPLDLVALHGENGAVLFGTLASVNCLLCVIGTPILTKLLGRFPDVWRLIAAQALTTVCYLLFFLFRGFIPSYYAMVFFLTGGEISFMLMQQPYLTSRVPASHRGRLFGITTFIGLAVIIFSLWPVGKVYDSFGSNTAWAVILIVCFLSIVVSVWLAFVDRKAYPGIGAPEKPAKPRHAKKIIQAEHA